MNYRISRRRHKYADFKNVTLEKTFLGALFYNQDAFLKIIETFDSNVFTNSRLKKIYDSVLKFYLTSGEVITDISILETISIQSNKKEIYKSLFKTIKKLGKRKHTTEYILAVRHKLEQLYSARIIELGSKDIIGSLIKAKDGGYENIDKANDIIKDLAELADIRDKACHKINPVHNFNKWLKEYEDYQLRKDKVLGISTGIPLIDKRIVGVRPAELALCIAGTGVGKSIFLLDIAVNCWSKYGDILYVTIEMPAKQLEDRFWCNLSGIQYDRFRELTLTRKQKKHLKNIKKTIKSHNNNFNIVDMQEGCMVGDIANEIRPYFSKNGKTNLKLVIVDYMNIIAGASGDVTLDWETQVGIAMNLKQKIARRFNIPTWSACQVTGENVAFSQHIKDNIDIGIKLEETENTDMNGVMIASYIKSRDFRGTSHNLETDRGHMRMYKKKGVSSSYTLIDGD